MKPITVRTLFALVASIVVAGLLAASARAEAPINTFPPSFTGSLMQGRTLTASNGTWSNNPTTSSTAGSAAR